MVRFRLTIMLLASMSSLTGCGTTQIENLAAMNIREPLPVIDARALVMDYLDENLKDPDSLKDFALISAVKRGALNYGAFNTGPSGRSFSNPMYCVCAKYNAKNSYGGYVGNSNYAFFISGGTVVRTIEGLRDDGFDFGSTSFDCLN